ncbi:BatD protein, partial [Candidatus Magnetobacterium bavaricum]
MKKEAFVKNAMVVIVILTLTCAIAVAEDVSFGISVEKEDLLVGQSTRLSLTFQGSRDVPEPQFRYLEGFSIRYIGPSTAIAITNGRYTSSITHNYLITPLKPGTFTIGPLAVTYKGNTYTSNAIKINVPQETTDITPKSPQEEVYGTKPYKKTERVFISLVPEKATVYINEAIPVSVKLLARDIGVRDIEFPELSNVNISIGQFDKPSSQRVNIGGLQYDVMEFKTTMFGTSTGQFKLGPASLECTVLIRQGGPFGNDDFFSGMFNSTKPVTLKSEVLNISVLPLPQDNKPRDFKGAVGSFDLDVGLSAAEVKVGDPVTVKMTITGKGNFNTVTVPAVSNTENLKLYDPYIKQNKGSKVFELAVMPTKNSVNSIGPFRFSYFDPASQTYHTITKEALPIKVTGSEADLKTAAVDAPSKGQKQHETFGRDLAFIKDSPGSLRKKSEPLLYLSPLYWLLYVVAMLVYVAVFVVHRRRQRLESDDGYARSLKAPKKARTALKAVKVLLDEGKAVEFYDGVFRLLSEYFADKFHLNSGETTSDTLVKVLRGKGVGEDILSMLEDILGICDKARFDVCLACDITVVNVLTVRA